MTPVVWMQCDCYVWPIVLSGFEIGRCGYCGVRPHTRVAQPPDGTATPLEEL